MTKVVKSRRTNIRDRRGAGMERTEWVGWKKWMRRDRSM
jgi:hypothetical protein